MAIPLYKLLCKLIEFNCVIPILNLLNKLLWEI